MTDFFPALCLMLVILCAALMFGYVRAALKLRKESQRFKTVEHRLALSNIDLLEKNERLSAEVNTLMARTVDLLEQIEKYETEY